MIGLLCIFTGNVFFLPSFKGKVQIFQERFLNRRAIIFGAKEIEEYSSLRKEKRIFRKNPKRAIQLFFKFVTVSLKYLLFSNQIEREWRNFYEELVSREFWENYLKL